MTSVNTGDQHLFHDNDDLSSDIGDSSEDSGDSSDEENYIERRALRRRTAQRFTLIAVRTARPLA